MKTIQLRSLLIWLFVSVIQFGAAACATGGVMDNYPMHSFSFDTRHDSLDVEVLDYQYGSSRQDGTHPEKERVAMGQAFPSGGTYGAMPRGDFLYVKWRIKKTGEICLDKVDLKSRLPADITGLRVHFVIKASQLYVYLISPGLKPASDPAGPVRQYSSQKQIQIYPDQSK